MVDRTAIAKGLVRDWSKTQWKEEIVRTLQRKNSGFKLDDLNEVWRTNHSQLAFVVLKAIENSQLSSVIAKRYLPLGRPYGAFHSIFNEPDNLRSREERNLELINEIVGPDLVPRIYTCDGINNLSLIERIIGQSSRQKLVDIVERLHSKPSNKLRTQMKGSLYELVEGVARFVGSVNAHYDELCTQYGLYVRDSKHFSAASAEVFKENMYQLMGPEQKRKRESEKNEKAERVDTLVDKLWKLKTHFNDRRVFVHGDFNAEHLVIPHSKDGEEPKEPITIDLETFHIGYMSEDMGAALVIHPLGNNYIIQESREFSNLLNRFLAFEHAYESQDDAAVEHLKQSENGAFADYIRSEAKMPSENYNNHVLGVMGFAMEKQLQLPVIYKKKRKNVKIEVRRKDDAAYLHTLFQEVRGMDRIFNGSTNPQKFREYFHTLGTLAEEVGFVKFDDGFLEGIKNGTVSDSIVAGHPYLGVRNGN
jgi:hypothetical protein